MRGIRCQIILLCIWVATTASYNTFMRAMSERLLTIIFGCFATVLAITGIALTYVQYLTYTRQSSHNTALSALENGHSSALTVSDDLQGTPRWWNGHTLLASVVNMSLIRAL